MYLQSRNLEGCSACDLHAYMYHESKTSLQTESVAAVHLPTHPRQNLYV
jgi:hypothetical protein